MDETSPVRRRGSQPAPRAQLPADIGQAGQFQEPAAAVEAGQDPGPAEAQVPQPVPQPVPQQADRRCGSCLTRQPITAMHPVADSWWCDDTEACTARGQAAGLYPQREDVAEHGIEVALAAREIQQGALL